MVNVITAKAKETEEKIDKLMQGGDLDPKQEKALKSCRGIYEFVLKTDIPEAIEALQKGNPKFAEDRVKDIRNEVIYCEGEFNGERSLLKSENDAMRELTGIVVAIIMVNVITAKAKETEEKINKLLQGGDLDPKQEKALKSCHGIYEFVLKTDIPEAIEALQKGNPKFAEDIVKDIGNEVIYCEGEFNGERSLLKSENDAMCELTGVVVAIVRQLL